MRMGCCGGGQDTGAQNCQRFPSSLGARRGEGAQTPKAVARPVKSGEKNRTICQAHSKITVVKLSKRLFDALAGANTPWR
jgi:hypothetical protein